MSHATLTRSYYSKRAGKKKNTVHRNFSIVDDDYFELDIPRAPQAVLLAIKQVAREDKQWTVTRKRLAQMTRYSERHVQRAINWLVEHKLIDRLRRALGQCNQYRLLTIEKLRQAAAKAQGAVFPRPPKPRQRPLPAEAPAAPGTMASRIGPPIWPQKQEPLGPVAESGGLTCPDCGGRWVDLSTGTCPSCDAPLEPPSTAHRPSYRSALDHFRRFGRVPELKR